MPTLLELQQGFLRGILDGEPGAASDGIREKGIEPARRLGIYANNALSNFVDSLRLSFPAVRRLVGDDYFDQCARAFHRLRPSRSGDLQHTGEGYSEYLRQLHRLDEYRYLADVARLEWLYQESLIAADHLPLNLARLGAVAPDDYANLRFRLHPAARLFASDYPAVEIWQANVGSAAQPPVIDLRKGADRALLARGRGGLQIYPLSSGEYVFLNACRQREPFEAAVEAAVAADRAFDAGAALRRFVQAEAIVDF
jgi:Putative DNA-binding domain